MKGRAPAAEGRRPRRGAVELRLALTLLLGTSTLLRPASPAHAQDRWWARDKALHLTVGVAIGGGCYGLLWAASPDRAGTRLALCTTLGLLPGLGKELYDAGQPGNRFSLLDLAWTTVGVLGASVALWGIERALRQPSAPSRAAQPN